MRVEKNIAMTRKLEVMREDLGDMWEHEAGQEPMNECVDLTLISQIRRDLLRLEEQYRARALNQLKQLGRQIPVF